MLWTFPATQMKTVLRHPFHFDLDTTKFPNGNYLLVTKVYYYNDEGGEGKIRYIIEEIEIQNPKKEIESPGIPPLPW